MYILLRYLHFNDKEKLSLVSTPESGNSVVLYCDVSCSEIFKQGTEVFHHFLAFSFRPSLSPIGRVKRWGGRFRRVSNICLRCYRVEVYSDFHHKISLNFDSLFVEFLSWKCVFRLFKEENSFSLEKGKIFQTGYFLKIVLHMRRVLLPSF